MHESNQGDAQEGTPPNPSAGPPPPAPADTPPLPPADDLTQPFVAGPPVEDELELSLAAAQGPPILRGLRIWFVLIGALGLLGILAGQAEMALSMAMAGAFVAAHAADRDPFYRPLHLLLTGVIVAGGAAVFAALAIWLATQSLPGEMRPVTVGIAGGGAVLCVLTAIRPLADGLASAVFRTLRPNHVLRLGARIVFMLVLFVIPGWSVFPDLIDTLASRQEPLLDTKQLIGSAVGLSMLALGGVGYLVRRDARQAFERLGLRMPKPAHYVVVVLGVVGLYLLNVGMEAFQRQVFPDLWEHDQRVNQMLVGGLGIGGGLLLGVCAGLGEELSMRGALQPRLGLIATAFLFSILHVQYSWVGILTIFILGITLGVIRDRTSTTVAILVHAIYDMLAAFTAGVSGNP